MTETLTEKKKPIVDDGKGTVVHDQALKLATYFASGQSGKNVIKKDGKPLARGYYSKTIDGDCPLGPWPTRRLAIEETLLWRADLLAKADRKNAAKPKQQRSSSRFKAEASA